MNMGWERMKSEQDRKNESKKQERIRGFMPMSPGAVVTGTLESIKIKPDGKGFFILRADEACTVTIQDEDSNTTLGTAQPGELVGVRKTGATKVLSELDLGTLVCVSYIELTERVGVNPKTKLEENNPYHHITVDVYRPEGV
jgi:hypothetical protein